MKRTHRRAGQDQRIATKGSRRKPIRDNIQLQRSVVQRCEERLALSASLAAEALIDLMGSSDWMSGQVDGQADPAIDQNLADPIENDQQVDSSVPIYAQSQQSNDAIPDSPDATSSNNLLDQARWLKQEHGLDGSGQTVAVIDSGIAWDHVTLGEGYGPGYRVVGGWDFAENDDSPYDDGPAGYHGTHVASLIAGESDLQSENDGNGIASGADLVSLRVFDDFGGGQLQWIESALQWVHDNQDSFESPITTVNLSVGAALSEANHELAMGMLEDELALLREDNILVFAAAGNFFQDAPSDTDVLYPASSSSVIAVSSVDSAGNLSNFAQRESGIYAAPGETVSGGVPDHVYGHDGKINDFASLSGTSMATPQLAAASVLVRETLIAEGIEPTADAVTGRLAELSSEQTDPATGLTYKTIDLRRLSEFLGDQETNPVAESEDLGTIDNATTAIDDFLGTNGSEQLELDLRDGIRLRSGDQIYSLDEAAVDGKIVIDVSGGDDSLSILGSEAAERLIANSDASASSTLSTNDFTIELKGFENIAFVGGGGPDRASLFDSGGDDTLWSHPSRATLEGIGFRYEVTEVDRIYVHATAGGNDSAFLHDGIGDDSLAVKPQFTSLRGEDTFQLAFGFERVYAYATSSGNDSIEISDSTGDDTLSISTSRTIITGPGYHVTANGFESTTADASAGGNDIARIYADSADANWDASGDRVQWTTKEGDVRIARGFERSVAFEDFERIDLLTQSLLKVDDDELWQSRRTQIDATNEIFESMFGDSNEEPSGRI